MRNAVSSFGFRVSIWAVTLLPAALLAGGAAPSPTPTPTAGPPKASENPPDVRARMPLRPTPFQPESKFPPPQQSEEEEAKTSNRPGEPDLLHGEPAVLLNGEPFPEKRPYDPRFPEARRVRYVAADANGPGDGTPDRPWKDLQDALCHLEPGDRLVVAAGIYSGAFRIAGACANGTAEAPIQVFARHAFLKAAGGADVLTVERAHWQFWEVQIALLDSESAGFVAVGPGAHDVAVDQSHIYEGKGPAVLLTAGSSRITLSNCHIHQSTGVRIEAGASDITLVNNHIHHNRSASVTIGGGGDSRPARNVAITGNRIHNDKGPALVLSHCEAVTASRNRLSNYRPDEDDGSGGEAVVVGSGCRGVTFENGSILEASVAVRVGEPTGSASPPEKIVFHHNYLENRLTAESTAVRIDAGRDVRFSNNVINRYADPFRIAAAGVLGLTIANNLILEPKVAFKLPLPQGWALFDYNVFGAAAALPGAVGEKQVGTAWMAAHMPHSRVVAGADLAGGDLSRVVGFSPVDAGKALDGSAFKGSAPDIGVAER